MNRDDVLWAAGFIEGEGCLVRQITTKRSIAYDYWVLTVSNTDLDVLEKLRDIFPAGRLYFQRRIKGNKPHWKPTWQWRLCRQPELYAALAAIYPFMGARRSARVKEAMILMGARGPWRENRRRVA